MWLNKLKVAIIQKDTDALDNLIDTMPKYDARKNLKEMQEVMYLFREALELLYTLKDETSTSMKQIKKNIDFLNVTITDSTNRLDIKS